MVKSYNGEIVELFQFIFTVFNATKTNTNSANYSATYAVHIVSIRKSKFTA